jgi:sugar lactone lactonase YvrE
MKHPFLFTALAATLIAGTASADTVYVTETGGNYVTEINGTEQTEIGNGYLQGPTGLVFDSAGDLFVANGQNGTITEFNSSGGYDTTIDAGLSSPRGMAIDSAGDIYVANQNIGTITKLTDNGGVYTASTFATGLTTPNDIAINAVGDLYVTNGLPGNYITEITPGGVKEPFAIAGEQLNGPNGIVFGPNDDIYVVNRVTSDVEKIDAAGVGTTYLAAGSLDAPKNLVFDSFGDLYVTDSGDNEVTEYNPQGQLIETFSDLAGPCFITTQDADTFSVPEPSTYALLLAGGAALFFLHRRRTLVPIQF